LDFRKPRRDSAVPTSHPTNIQDEQVGTFASRASRKPAALPTVGAALGSASESPWDIEAGLPPRTSLSVPLAGFYAGKSGKSRGIRADFWGRPRKPRKATADAERLELRTAHESPNLPRSRLKGHTKGKPGRGPDIRLGCQHDL